MANKKNPSAKTGANKAFSDFEIRMAMDSAHRAGKPTYRFAVGDHPRMGCWQDCVVAEVLEDGAAYVVDVRSEKKKNSWSDEVIVHSERYLVAWYRLRPAVAGTTNFETNKDIRLSYSQRTVESLLEGCLSAGFDMDPVYQRGNVWTDEERCKLLDSVFMHAEIGRFVLRLRETSCGDENALDTMYEVVDGKQRISTLADFYLNKFAYRGVYYNDLSGMDKYCFMNTMLSVAEMTHSSQADAIRVFLMLNQSGHQMSEDVLKKAEKLLTK